MIGAAALREVVGADALGTVARADLALALRGPLGLALGALGLIEPARAES